MQWWSSWQLAVDFRFFFFSFRKRMVIAGFISLEVLTAQGFNATSGYNESQKIYSRL